jgi:hypothetical protein
MPPLQGRPTSPIAAVPLSRALGLCGKGATPAATPARLEAWDRLNSHAHGLLGALEHQFNAAT